MTMYPWPDPTNERIKKLEKENAELRKRLIVSDDMVDRALRKQHRSELWDQLLASESKRDVSYIQESREDMRDALNAALDNSTTTL